MAGKPGTPVKLEPNAIEIAKENDKRPIRSSRSFELLEVLFSKEKNMSKTKKNNVLVFAILALSSLAPLAFAYFATKGMGL